MFVEASGKAVSEIAIVRLCQKIIPCEKRWCWRAIKGYFSQFDFLLVMLNYGVVSGGGLIYTDFVLV